VTELATKEASYILVEEERKNKEVEDKEGNTLPMDLDALGTYTTGAGT
jgi:hypothetical protein